MEAEQIAELVAMVAETLPKTMLHQIVGSLEKLGAQSNFNQRMAISKLTSPGDAREIVARLIRRWNEQCPELPPRSLAVALQAASHVDDYHRNRGEVQLVWTGPDLGGLPFRRTAQALLELIESARKSLLLVAFAAYKVPEIIRAINTAADNGISVACVLESEEESGGRVSFSPSKHLGLTPSVKNYVWPFSQRQKDPLGRYGSLHAKCAVVDTDLLFVSSANLTEYALNLNIELGVLIKGGPLPSSVEKHFHALISSGCLERIVQEDVG